MVVLAPLIKNGWTFRDIEEHSIEELLSAQALLERKALLDQGAQIEGRSGAGDPDFAMLKAKYYREKRLVYGDNRSNLGRE